MEKRQKKETLTQDIDLSAMGRGENRQRFWTDLGNWETNKDLQGVSVD